MSPFFFFNDTATTEIYTLSLHDALPILQSVCFGGRFTSSFVTASLRKSWRRLCGTARTFQPRSDRKSTRLNSSHSQISYAVFCLKKKKKQTHQQNTIRSK